MLSCATYVNGHGPFFTQCGVLGFVDKTVCAFSNDLQVTEDIHTALAPCRRLSLFNAPMAKSANETHGDTDYFSACVLNIHFSSWQTRILF